MKTVEQKLRLNVSLVIIGRSLTMSLGFSIATIVSFWKSEGLSAMDIALLQGFFSLALSIFEIPSGYFADVWGRKKVLLIASLSLALGCFISIYAGNMSGFLWSEMAWAFGFALISGADEALLFDSLTSLKISYKFPQIWSRAQFWSMISGACSPIFGGIAYSYHSRMPYLLAGVGFLSMFVLYSFLFEPKHNRPKQNLREHIAELLSLTKLCLWKNKQLAFLLLQSACLFVLVQTAVWYYNPHWELLQIPVHYFGGLFFLMNIVSAYSVARAKHSCGSEINTTKFTLCGLLLLGLTYLCNWTFISIWVLGCIFVQQYVRGHLVVIGSAKFNRQLESHLRATGISVKSFVEKLCYATVLLSIASLNNLLTVYLTLAILSACAFTLIAIIRTKS